MKIILSSQHLANAQKLEAYAKEKVKKLVKFSSNIESINVRLIGEKSHRGQEKDFYCEITVHIPGHILEIVDVERTMDKAVDRAVERMKRTLVKNKEKHLSRNHHRGIISKVLRRISF